MNNNLTPEAAAQLQEGISLLLSRWAAFQMAVQNEWGGRDSGQKPQQLADNIFHLLTQSKDRVYIDEVDLMLDEFMDTLNTVIEDGSIEEVAEKLMVMHEECSEGNFDSVKKLRETSIPNVSYVRQGSNDSEDSEDNNEDDTLSKDNSSEMEIDAPKSQSSPSQKDPSTDQTSQRETPQVVDGWTVVPSRRSKGKKK
ncbi:hypothetical protein ACP275_12G153200 [Erythranthe tilingii]